MKPVLIILVYLVGFSFAGVAFVDKGTQGEFEGLCRAGIKSVQIGAVIIFCKAAGSAAAVSKIEDHSLDLNTLSAPASLSNGQGYRNNNKKVQVQEIYVQEPPIHYYHRVWVKGNVTPSPPVQTKVYVLPRKVTHSFQPYAFSSAFSQQDGDDPPPTLPTEPPDNQEKPQVYYRSSQASPSSSAIANQGSPPSFTDTNPFSHSKALVNHIPSSSVSSSHSGTTGYFSGSSTVTEVSSPAKGFEPPHSTYKYQTIDFKPRRANNDFQHHTYEYITPANNHVPSPYKNKPSMQYRHASSFLSRLQKGLYHFFIED